jgi:hypothetical protein
LASKAPQVVQVGVVFLVCKAQAARLINIRDWQWLANAIAPTRSAIAGLIATRFDVRMADAVG